MARRLYIYRCARTDEFAVTAEKKHGHLPRNGPPQVWQFWMQIGPAQAQAGRLGFDVRTAVHAIWTDGFYLFTGSAVLLAGHRSPLCRAQLKEGHSNA